MTKKQIILSSGSPRRQELLREAGINYDLRIIETDESFPDDISINKVAEFIAISKAEAHSNTISRNEIILTADTVVAMDNKIYGKPKSKTDAIKMLLTFSDNTHQVFTGVCLKSSEKLISFTCKSNVTFAPISESEAEYYFNLDNPMDKAGSYGIQDWIGRTKVLDINGSYTNIMGLPVPQVIKKISEF